MKAIILLSGGIDSTVMLALARQQGRRCLALSFNYGQRHKIELDSARAIAAYYNTSQHIITLNNTTFAGSSLMNESSVVPSDRTSEEIALAGVPTTYVPARNTLFLAHAISFAEITGAAEIYFGANATDINPYPDCRPAYFNAFQTLIELATKQAVEGNAPRLVTPLIHWNKAEIIEKGMQLGAPLELTFSCYAPLVSNAPCNHCDACILRNEGFAALKNASLVRRSR
jgi:7-cyano-7-deazaguanine synthase